MKNVTGQPLVQEKSIPYFLLEVLVYGVEEDKGVIKKMCDSLQNQFAKTKKGKYVRILWYIDKGEKTNQEKKEWLLENCNSKYAIFTPEKYIVKLDYVKTILIKIKKLEEALISFKGEGILVTQKAPKTLTLNEQQPLKLNELKIV